MSNVCLIGFMGSGKSSVAREIGRKYNKKYVELDKIIEQEAAMAISDIFEKHGEGYFRDLETKALEMLECEDTVISCGGGIVLRDENVALLKKNATVIWLKTEPFVIFERIKNAEDRPLLKGNMTAEYIENMLNLRQKRYKYAADDSIVTDCMSIEHIAEYIYNRYMK